jgi:hypothetical protein
VKGKLILEIAATALVVLVPTFFIYRSLADVSSFWDAQSLWSAALALCWAVVAGGYYHQGWLVHERQSAAGVSVVLPAAVFLVQCILFVKGIYYEDWALIVGAVMVNSGVIFSLSQIWKVRRDIRRR